MNRVVRLSLSLEKSLYDKLEQLVQHEGYSNRSEFVRDMIRRQLVEREWQESEREVIATVTLVYDHHKSLLSERLTDLQHQHHSDVLATTHVHLDETMCAEMILVRGKPATIRELTNQMAQQKGVLHADYSMASTGKSLA